MSIELREQIAAVQHEIWSHWMRYLFSRTEASDSAGSCIYGGAIIPNTLVLRWQRQMETPYAELTDKERESDRHQADKVITLFTGTITALRQRAEAAEAALAAVPDYAAYAADVWQSSQFPQPFTEWLAAQPEVQP